MNAELVKEMEAYGYKIYDHAGDAVGMTDVEKELLDHRITLAHSIRKRREKLGLSQQDLAKRLKIGQRRVAKIEWADPGISLDEMLSAYSALGGRVAIKELPARSSNGAKQRKKKAKAAV